MDHMTTTQSRAQAQQAAVRRQWLGSSWEAERFAQTGWLLLPLRLFLGVTFVFAAFQKFASPSFFDASNPASVQAQMKALAPTSPIGPLVRLSLDGGPLIGIMIAVAELLVGVATLLGLKARWAAGAGALLSLTFFLTVSWNTRPYYYGADIVFMFAWTPFVMLGAAGVLSLDGYARERGRASRRGEATRQLIERRSIVTAGALSLLSAATASLVAHVGRGGSGTTTGATGSTGGQPVARGQHTGSTAGGPAGSGSTPPTHPAGHPSGAPAGMRAIASTSSLAVGQGHPFTDPATGNPAWLVRTGASSAVAFSAVCTHAGCPVNFDPSAHEFVCPCHGGTYSASTGAVLGGPPPAALPAIDVSIVGGEIYAK